MLTNNSSSFIQVIILKYWGFCRCGAKPWGQALWASQPINSIEFFFFFVNRPPVCLHHLVVGPLEVPTSAHITGLHHTHTPRLDHNTGPDPGRATGWRSLHRPVLLYRDICSYVPQLEPPTHFVAASSDKARLSSLSDNINMTHQHTIWGSLSAAAGLII